MVEWRPERRNLVISELLGSGSFGDVFKVEDPKGNIYALKISNITNKDTPSKEVKSLSDIKNVMGCHPNISCYLDHFIYDLGGKKYYGILSDFIDGVNLFHKLYEDWDGMEVPPNRFKTIMRTCLQGLAFMHSREIVHRDIKAENIMIKSNDECVLIDLGLACKADECTDIGGSIAYFSPAKIIMLRGGHKSNFFSDDVWALGTVFYEIALRKMPIHDSDEMTDGQYMKAIETYKGPEDDIYERDLTINSIIRAMLNPNEKNRITAKEALESLSEGQGKPERKVISNNYLEYNVKDKKYLFNLSTKSFIIYVGSDIITEGTISDGFNKLLNTQVAYTFKTRESTRVPPNSPYVKYKGEYLPVGNDYNLKAILEKIANSIEQK